MMAELNLIPLIITIGVVCTIFGVFFALRSIYKLKDWRSGNKDELWSFLSLIIGGISAICIGLTVCVMMISGASEGVILASMDIIFIVFIPALVAMGLMTYYYIAKWRSQK